MNRIISINKSIRKSNIQNKLNEPINNNHTLVSCYTVVKRSKIDNFEKRPQRAGDALAAGRQPPATSHRSSATKGTARFLLRLADLLSASFRCDARLSKSTGRKPASIGRLREGKPETLVNTGLAGRCSGNARKQWASGQAGLLRCGFCYGFPFIRYRHRYSPKIKEEIQINTPINAI